MEKNNAAQDREAVRKILVASIFILLAALIVLLLLLLTRGTCSNTAGSGILPKSTPTLSPASSAPTDEPALPSASATDEPDATARPLQANVERVMTVGTMDDVLERLEQFKLLPQSETLILLDVGHGGFDGGTVGIESKVTEAELNLAVSRLLAEELGKRGFYVFMTRMGDYAVAQTKDEDMNLRKSIMHLDIFDCSVSIHMNALPTDRNARGFRLYHYAYGTEGETLAKTILASIRELTDETRTNTLTGDLMVVREPVAPSVLIECGFLSNVDDERRLRDPSYQKTIAAAIAAGIEKYFAPAS